MAKVLSPLDRCPSCGSGTLEVILALKSSSPLDEPDRVDLLACNECRAVFLPECRGRYLAMILRPKTDPVCACSAHQTCTTRYNGQTFSYCAKCLMQLSVYGEPDRVYVRD